MKTFNLKTRILVPLALFSTLMLGVIVSAIYLDEQAQMDKDFSLSIQAVTGHYREALKEKGDKLGVALEILADDPFLRSALAAGDRTALFSHASHIFRTMKAKHHITHFYFHDSQRVNLLRIHQPDRFGDSIDRFTLLTAERTKALSQGVELGPMGTFTLRAVLPLWDKDRLIGYFELGEEVAPLIKDMKKLFNVDLIMLIDKHYLRLSDWVYGGTMSEQEDKWNLYPNQVAVANTLDQLPQGVSGLRTRSDKAITMKDKKLISHHGQIFWVRMMPFRDAGGRNVGHMIIMRNMTARIHGTRKELVVIGGSLFIFLTLVFFMFYRIIERMELSLEEAQGQVLQSEKMASIGQLAAGVAHEINNPLGYINSNLHTLKRYLTGLEEVSNMANRLAAELPADNADVIAFDQLKSQLDLDFMQQDLRELVNESMEGATRAQQIVQDLRNFSRINSQQRELFDIEKGLDATLNIVNNELKYKANVHKEYVGLPPYECVGSQLNQVFMNLLVNAAHAIEEFGDIIIRTGRKDADWLWVEVEDTGKGIADDIRSKIFDPFFTSKPVGEGTGLGLSLTYKIIKDHHGEIELDTKVGRGTRFRVYFPLAGKNNRT